MQNISALVMLQKKTDQNKKEYSKKKYFKQSF